MGGGGARFGTFDVCYRSRNLVKGQVLADFVVEFTPSLGAPLSVCQVTIRPWKVYIDGASNARGSGVGIVLQLPEGVRLEKPLRLVFKDSNNKAEYEALIVGLQAVCKLGVEDVDVFLDSRLVVNQVDGRFEARHQRMCQYQKSIESIRYNFRAVTMNRLSRNHNSHADSLTTLGPSLNFLIP